MYARHQRFASCHFLRNSRGKNFSRGASNTFERTVVYLTPPQLSVRDNVARNIAPGALALRCELLLREMSNAVRSLTTSRLHTFR
jgi:hypothetical protein